MTERDWKIFRENNDIQVKSSSVKVPIPLRNWKESEFFDIIRENLFNMGFKIPSAIQMQAIPIGM